METTFNLIRGVLTLDEETYRSFLLSENVMKRGFLLFLACFFIATFPVFGQTLINGVRGVTPEDAEAFQEQFLAVFERFQPPDMDEAMLEQITNDIGAGMNMGVELDALPTPLPRPIAAFFRALGAWFTAALRAVGPWLGYGAVVLLIAKLAGGPGILNPFFGLTALYAIPNLIRILSFIPFLGPILGLIALVWGAAVYIRSVQISQDFSGGKAALITLLPLLILMLLTACVATTAFAGLASAISAAQ